MVATNDDIINKLEEIKQVLMIPYSSKTLEEIKAKPLSILTEKA